MTTPASPDHAEPWYLLGAGNMGLLAAHYLQRAGFTVIAPVSYTHLTLQTIYSV